jgi:hypothetical protein
MARTTGIVLMTGAITLANQSVFHDQPIDWRIPIASGFAAMGFSLVEKAVPQAAVMMAWTGLLVVLLTRIDPNTPSPTESLLTWWNQGGKK